MTIAMRAYPERQKQAAKSLLRSIIETAETDRIAAIAACDSALSIISADWPATAEFYNSAKAEAEWWADIAADNAACEMLVALLRRCVQYRTMNARARKRALVALWNDLDASERAAFLEMVDPGSKGEA